MKPLVKRINKRRAGRPVRLFSAPKKSGYSAACKNYGCSAVRKKSGGFAPKNFSGGFAQKKFGGAVKKAQTRPAK
ncbi:MAG TPA: hypothetical protein H9851_07785 [Candidatus Borkfalkia faecavium]|uniref:Uncharacterized protein n=1 Tax=Candidatus Borkfalkia faecavium TaxID=2838508 RepID=A0A9D2AW01_9FIRM|nr:hypothetical protein [Candidatus Borkfalkia faecavium]